jgi:hypothetical protein
MVIAAVCVLGFAMSCSRQVQTESLKSSENKDAFKSVLVRLSANTAKPVSVFCVLREDEAFSLNSRGQVFTFVEKNLKNFYTFKTDTMSEHQKIMIDDFIGTILTQDINYVQATDTGAINFLVVAYVRSYTTDRQLHFDFFDFKTGSRVGSVKYMMSKMTNSFTLMQ